MAKEKQENSKKKSTTKQGGFSGFLSKAVKWLWLLLIIGFISAFAIFMLVSFTKMPDTEELENPNYEYASLILADDMQELGKYFSKNREGLTYDELNPFLVKALIATEDERFHKHSGVDARGTVRAVMFLGKKGGASTISQQLAKQFFTKRSRSFIRRVWQKLKEWVIAIQFEKRYTKEEIIAMYLNKFDFIYSSHGVSAAAKTYFGKDQKKLTLDEASVLVGMLKNPYTYNPKRFPENAIKRRNVVMNQMVRNGYLAQSDYDELKKKTLDMTSFNRTINYEGPAPYLRETIKKDIKKILSQDQYKKPDGTVYDLDEDGLKVYTTINVRMQEHAERAMKEHMKTLQNTFSNVWEKKDPWTYKADSKQVKQRKEFLNSAVRSSDRYVNMKNKLLGPVIQKITAQIENARLWDEDIRRMLNEEKKGGYLKKLIRDKYISKSQANVYMRIMSDPLWKELKSQRRVLDDKAKKAFNTKTKMYIFAYNDAGEALVTMTPMDSIRYHHKLMQLGSVSIDPRNGHIKTWVGGIGNKYFKYDHVRSNRQVGSTFKPFVYSTAIAQAGFSPCHKIMDIRHEIPAGDPNFGLLKSWAPDNSDGKFTGQLWTLRDALKKSKNSISVGLLKEMGSVEPIRNLAEKLGVDKSKIPSAPSIVLGAAQVNVLEMTAAYATFANYGIYNEPMVITKIEDKDGRVIYNSVPKQHKVLSEKYNEVMVNLLQYASSGLTHLLSNDQWGGKTGTTNDYVDGWFMGISPELVVGTWVGGEYNWIRFLELRHGSGGAMARPFFLKFMQKLETDPKIKLNKDAYFKIPDGDRLVTDCSQYEKKTPPEDEKERAKKIKELLDNFDDDLDN